MSSFAVPPLTPDSPLAPIITLQALGDIELEVAVCELSASDDKVPLEALEVIRREPMLAALLIGQQIEEQLYGYYHLEIPAPRGINNSLIVLASLHQPSSAAEILRMLESDYGQTLLDSSRELIPKTLGETISGLTDWARLLTAFKRPNGFGWAPVTVLIESLPYLVYRTSSDPSTAAQKLIRFFDSTSGELATIAALPTVLTLLTLVVPETLPDTLRINQLISETKRISEEKVKAIFADPEGSLKIIRAEIEDERLSDAVRCFHYGPVFPPHDEIPETIADAIELLEKSASVASCVIAANRRLKMEPEKAIPALLDYVKSKLATEPVDDDDEWDVPSEVDFGSSYAVLMLQELRCTEILPLLLPAFEVNNYDCLPGFEEVIDPILLGLVGQTAPSPEFVLQWIRRKTLLPDCACSLAQGLSSMVIEGRADRLHIISMLRELYFELIASDDAEIAEYIADYASLGLLTLGDIDFVEAALKTVDLNGDSLTFIKRLVGESDDLPVAISKASGIVTRSWFLKERLISANLAFYDCLDAFSQQDDDMDSGEADDDDDADFWDDDEEGSDPDSDFQSIFGSGLSLPWLDTSPSDDLDFNDDPPEKTGTFRNTQKIGRNEPCPCGSGRKYKKCCGNS